jgi:hypothetical protein
MTARTRWIAIIIGLLVGNAIAVAVLIALSGGTSKSRVLPDYSVETWKK